VDVLIAGEKARGRTVWLLGAVAVIVLFGPPASAHGETRSATYNVHGWCYGQGIDASWYRVSLPPRAAGIRATPRRRTVITGPDGVTTARVVRVRSRDGLRSVRWQVAEAHCEPGGPWSVGRVRFKVRFRQVPRRPPLGGRLAKRAARIWLYRRFEAYPYTQGKRLSCARRVNRSTRSCRFSFGIGDSSYRGKIRVSLFAEPNLDLHARLRFRYKGINHYCLAVLDRPRSSCIDIFRGRTRVD
jgi:hypothetical protein